MATWSPESLLRMDEQFVVAVQVAFRRGLEDPDTAARTYDLRTRRPWSFRDASSVSPVEVVRSNLTASITSG
jgi:hypothetical protein